MLIGELPSEEDVAWLSKEWTKRAEVPKHVFDMLDAMPTDTHPMTQFSMGILAMRTESVFGEAYNKGISKKEYWDPFYEDIMNLIAIYLITSMIM